MVTRAAVLAKATEWVGMMEETGKNDIWFSRDWGIEGQAWCFAFVQSCFYYAGAPLPHQSMYCPYGIQWARDNGQAIEVGEAPIPGDVVFFSWDMSSWGRWTPGTGDHVGIVEWWDGGDVIGTIEGNIGSPQGVWRKERSISGTVVCFWRPTVYEGGPLTLPTPQPEDDMFSDQDRALLMEASARANELRGLLLETHARTSVLWENIGRQWEVQDRMGVIWPLIVGFQDRFTRLEESLGLIATELDEPETTEPPETPPTGPMPPVTRPPDAVVDVSNRVNDLESRLGNVEAALRQLLDRLTPSGT